MEITGTVYQVLFFEKEKGYCILKIKEKETNKIYTVTGICTELQILEDAKKSENLPCYVVGELHNHPKYGEQIKASLIRIETMGLRFFLSNMIPGVKPSFAYELLKHHTEQELIEALDNDPEKFGEISGIKGKKLKSVINAWNKYKTVHDLVQFFAEHNIPINLGILTRIYNYYGANAINVIKQSPYSLTSIKGIGFKTADKIALGLGVPNNSPERIKALMNYILKEEAAEYGHTYIPEDILFNKMKEKLGDTIDDAELLTILENFKLLANYKVENEKIGLINYYKQEYQIYQEIKQRLATPHQYIIDSKRVEAFLLKKEQELNFTLGDKQKEAVREIASNGKRVFILCGYAGTGKSTVSKIILDFYKEFFFDYHQIITCAFTGMASKNIQEKTGYPGKTIHSLIGIKGNEKPIYNENNPIPYKVVLIDEASMINLNLFYMLIKAIPKDSIIIIVGDNAQLPPIGEGNVFSDLLTKKWIPQVKLETIYRQSQDSVLKYFANTIRSGELPSELSLDKTVNFLDFAFIHKDIKNYVHIKRNLTTKELDSIKETFHEEVKMLLLKTIDKVVEKRELSNLNKIWNIQVITPMKNTPLGTKALNSILQARLNTIEGKQMYIKDTLLKEYDKVIHLKNQTMKYLPKKTYDNLRESGCSIKEAFEKALETKIYNGFIGLVYNLEKEEEYFTVRYYENNKDDFIVFYNLDDYGSILDLAYALTIHKTQGGEFDYVFIPIVNAFYVMLNNKLMYTALTRARKKAFVIGQPYAFKRACTNVDVTLRFTWLKDFE